jgi:uncharacterized protein
VWTINVPEKYRRDDLITIQEGDNQVTATAKNSFLIIDSDSHVLETPDIWTKYLDPEYRVLARSWFWPYGDQVNGEVFLNGATVPGLNQSGIPRHAVWKPGYTFEQIGSLDPKIKHPVNPGASDPKARLVDMNAMRIDKAVLYPTLFLHYFPVLQNPDVAWALARAYNTWIQDFAREDPERLIPVAVLPTQNVGLAVEELRRVAGLGFRAAMIVPLFNNDHYPAQRANDPLWDGRAGCERRRCQRSVH